MDFGVVSNCLLIRQDYGEVQQQQQQQQQFYYNTAAYHPEEDGGGGGGGGGGVEGQELGQYGRELAGQTGPIRGYSSRSDAFVWRPY